MALAVSMDAIIWHRNTSRPGMKKLAVRVSGLNSTRGRTSTGSGRPASTCFSDSWRARLLLTFRAAAATLDSDPSTSTSTWAVSPAAMRRE